jgi:hypothetical protein
MSTISVKSAVPVIHGSRASVEISIDFPFDEAMRMNPEFSEDAGEQMFTAEANRSVTAILSDLLHLLYAPKTKRGGIPVVTLEGASDRIAAMANKMSGR